MIIFKLYYIESIKTLQKPRYYEKLNKNKDIFILYINCHKKLMCI